MTSGEQTTCCATWSSEEAASSFDADYVRGRCVKTTVEVTSHGIVTLETVNRGEAALRWVDKLKGKKYLRVVG